MNVTFNLKSYVCASPSLSIQRIRKNEVEAEITRGATISDHPLTMDKTRRRQLAISARPALSHSTVCPSSLFPSVHRSSLNMASTLLYFVVSCQVTAVNTIAFPVHII